MDSQELPKIADNRSYNYSSCESDSRAEYPYIINMVKAGSHVIDLGCGDGALLKQLKEEKKISGTGVELSSSGVKSCQKKGLDVCQGRIDELLNYIEDKSFDYAICNVTIQMLMYPEILMSEMKRISKYQIVSFPNFAYCNNRLELLLKGRMPQKMLYGYHWYNTGHIHQLSYKDFMIFCRDHDFNIVEYQTVDNPRFWWQKMLPNLFPNLFSGICLFLLRGGDD